jgi:hypothetical protein
VKQPRWKNLGFKSPQSYAAQVGANKRRISQINARLDELGWFDGVESEEGARLDDEKGRLVDQIAPPLPSFDDVAKALKNR